MQCKRIFLFLVGIPDGRDFICDLHSVEPSGGSWCWENRMKEMMSRWFFVDIREASILAEGFLWALRLDIKATLAAAGFTEWIIEHSLWQTSAWIMAFTSSEDENTILQG